MLDFSEIIVHHLADRPLARLGANLHWTKHMTMSGLAFLLSAVVVVQGARSNGKLHTALEAFVTLIREEIVRPALGHDTDTFLPYFLTLFTFIFSMNLLGLVPFGASATGNISVTAALSLLTLLLINGAGIWRHGFFRHFKNLIPHGVPFWVVPLIFAIELMGYFTKCLALCIRLFANMTAGHLVILLFLGLILLFGQANPWTGLFIAPISVGLALGLYALELLVALIQAYVFTMLTAIFVGGALHPEH
ncbi:MAG: F0F1 ATP synthase subunit A [Elusimicrobia bacterium]|nr:F0F1 ATP synthase subunit A [Elusimicrobiota bacterium]